MSVKVFVYGTLMSGCGRGHVLEDSTFLGEVRTAPKFKLIDLRAFPGMVDGEESILGELYEVHERVIPTLDAIEGFHGHDSQYNLYNRTEIELENGDTAISYLYNGSYPGADLGATSWRDRK